MKIVVIEDDPNKASQVITFLKDLPPPFEINITHKRSYQSGLSEILEQACDLIMLDMSLPTYDTRPGEDAYKFRHIGGHEILTELKRKGKRAKVVVLTQFERFGEGNQFISLPDLKRILRRDFSENYIGTISYHPNKTSWQKELVEIIQNLTVK